MVCCPLDAALQPSDLRRELAIGRIAQKSVDAALVLDGADRRGGHPQPNRAERVRKDRSPLQIGQTTALGLDIGMADIVPDLDTLAGDHAFPCHTRTSAKFHSENTYA